MANKPTPAESRQIAVLRHALYEERRVTEMDAETFKQRLRDINNSWRDEAEGLLA